MTEGENTSALVKGPVLLGALLMVLGGLMMAWLPAGVGWIFGIGGLVGFGLWCLAAYRVYSGNVDR
ncbi:hypothetical protein [Aminobacter sp. MET-1]|uniref:hypothetical protein n=1 Tax=Aminobacter sp. MET-1 TaxID=2951085 RepID=UPI0022699546|nr:hypothetical protein [Aminobacter sp. MET-1]MCX8571116.1 hypothetical protein [Aminobacter sp. MET-1]MCX8573215.1 hypothetical protein [Aminobacter sp. MET-1]